MGRIPLALTACCMPVLVACGLALKGAGRNLLLRGRFAWCKREFGLNGVVHGRAVRDGFLQDLS